MKMPRKIKRGVFWVLELKFLSKIKKTNEKNTP